MVGQPIGAYPEMEFSDKGNELWLGIFALKIVRSSFSSLTDGISAFFRSFLTLAIVVITSDGFAR